MKVLKEGNWKNPWSMEMVCDEHDCGATLLVEEEDVKPVDYSKKKDYYAECVVCGRHVPIVDKDLPLRMKKKLEASRKQDIPYDPL